MQDQETQSVEQSPLAPEQMNTFGQDQLEPQPAAAPAFRPPARKRKAKSKVDSSHMVMGGLIALGVVGLYLIKSHCGPQQANAGEIRKQDQVDQALLRLKQTDTGRSSRGAQLVTRLRYEASQRQLPLSQIGDNPFLFRLSPTLMAQANAQGGPDSSNYDPAAEELARQQIELQAASEKLAALVVQSTVVRPEGRSSAIISDFVLSIGDTIQGWTVSEIRPGEVVLSYQDLQAVLRMKD